MIVTATEIYTQMNMELVHVIIVNAKTNKIKLKIKLMKVEA